MRRVLAAHPSVISVVQTVDPAGFDLVISDQLVDEVASVEIPDRPLRWLATTLSSLVASPEVFAYTPSGPPLRTGIPAHFPSPLHSLWAEENAGMLAAPTNGVLAGVSVQGLTTVGVVEDRNFLTAISAVGPALAYLGNSDPIAAMRQAGLAVAEKIGRQQEG